MAVLNCPELLHMHCSINSIQKLTDTLHLSSTDIQMKVKYLFQSHFWVTNSHIGSNEALWIFNCVGIRNIALYGCLQLTNWRPPSHRFAEFINLMGSWIWDPNAWTGSIRLTVPYRDHISNNLQHTTAGCQFSMFPPLNLWPTYLNKACPGL